MPADDFARAQQHRRPLRRRQFLAGRALLCSQLAMLTGLPAAAWRIEPDANGRPLAIGPGGAWGPDVSLSHSGERIAAATTARGRIGIDIEMTREDRSPDAAAGVALSPAEREVVAREGQGAFLRFWTLREAIGKAGGEGLSLALAIDGQALLGVSEAPVLAQVNGAAYALAHRPLSDGSLAVAWRLTEDIPDPLAQLASALAGEGAALAGC